MTRNFGPRPYARFACGIGIGYLNCDEDYCCDRSIGWEYDSL
jgi:hypothetical protein